MKSLSSRIQRIGPSQTVAIDARYKRMLAAGENVLSLGAGEPDLPTPTVAVEAAIRSMREGLTRYTPVTGLPSLREAVAEKFVRENGITSQADDVLITSGAKHAIFNALLATIEDGDEVLIPSPYWTTYPELVRFLGGKPVIMTTGIESGFKMTSAQLKASITPRSKLLILNSPCNPTGAAYSKDDLSAIGEVVVENDLYVLSDEIYEHITYGDFHPTSIASLSPELAERTATVNGMSKAFAMTGWRLGYVTAPKAWMKAMSTIHSHGTHHPANVSQVAALACLREGSDFLPVMRTHFQEAKDFTFQRLKAIPNLRVFEPQGAFYAFCDVGSYLNRRTTQGKLLETSMELAEYLLEEKKLATVPGSAFGCEGWLRLSFANSTDYLGNCLDRLSDGLAELG